MPSALGKVALTLRQRSVQLSILKIISQSNHENPNTPRIHATTGRRPMYDTGRGAVQPEEERPEGRYSSAKGGIFHRKIQEPVPRSRAYPTGDRSQNRCRVPAVVPRRNGEPDGLLRSRPERKRPARVPDGLPQPRRALRGHVVRHDDRRPDE